MNITNTQANWLNAKFGDQFARVIDGVVINIHTGVTIPDSKIGNDDLDFNYGVYLFTKAQDKFYLQPLENLTINISLIDLIKISKVE